eukprot:s738_g21.t1
MDTQHQDGQCLLDLMLDPEDLATASCGQVGTKSEDAALPPDMAGPLRLQERQERRQAVDDGLQQPRQQQRVGEEPQVGEDQRQAGSMGEAASAPTSKVVKLRVLVRSTVEDQRHILTPVELEMEFPDMTPELGPDELAQFEAEAEERGILSLDAHGACGRHRNDDWRRIRAGQSGGLPLKQRYKLGGESGDSLSFLNRHIEVEKGKTRIRVNEKYLRWPGEIAWRSSKAEDAW